MRLRSKLVPPADPVRLFVEYAWDKFDALHALALLLSPTVSFFGQNDILFAALGAWVVAPGDDDLRKAAIIRAVRQKLVKIETQGQAKAGIQLVVADIIERLIQPNIAAFYEEVYYPIGGLKTLTGTLSRPDFYKSYHEHTGNIDTALEIAEIYHYHYNHLNSRERYRQASLNTAAPLIKVVGSRAGRRGGDAVDNIKKQWRASRKSISLAYAASSLRFRSGSKYTDLLHVMQSGGRAFKSPPDVISKMIGRARFFEQEVLAQTYKSEGEGIDLRAFDDIKVRTIKPPLFDEAEQARIAHAFARKRTGRMSDKT